MFATLNEMYGNRTVCGIGRGDSAVRTLNGRPVNLADLSACVEVIRGLANGEAVEYKGSTLRFPWNPNSRLPIWVAAYGPKALKVAGEVGDGYILQLADPDIAAWSIQAVRDAAAAAGRDPDALTMCVAAPAYVTDGSDASRAHALDQCRWFGGMVGNHVADLVARYGSEGEAVPRSLTDYIAGRQGYDYNVHGRAGHPDTEFVPDEIVERFCIIGPPETQVARLRELAGLGVGHFGLYLQHDAQDATLAAYGNEVIPAVSEHLLARS
jgi:probable F420-dependent oxidoreductase